MERVRTVGPGALLAVLMAGCAALLLWLSRGTTFFFDEWDFVQRRAGGVESLLEPHNEHLSLIPVAVYKLLFATVGLDPHWPYQVLVVVAHLLVGLLVFRLASPRVGPWGALAAAVVVLFCGRAWENLVWAFQIGFVGSVAFGLAAFLALERGDRRGDVLATVALAASIASSSLGVPFAAGVAAELVWARAWKRLWVVGAAVAVYGVWYLGYGASTIDAANAGPGLEWAAQAAAAAAGAMLGLGKGAGWVVLAAIVALVVWGRTLSPRLIGLLAVAGAFWVLTGLARAGISVPESSRYLYIGVVVLVLVCVEALRDRALPRPALGVAAGLAVLGAALGSDDLRDGARSLRSISDVVQAELGALEPLRGAVPEDFRPDERRAPQIFAGDYFRAVDRTGDSPADTTAEIADAGGEARAESDRLLVAAGRFLLQEQPEYTFGTEAPQVTRQTGDVETRGPCITVDGGSAEVVAPANGLWFSAREGQAELRFRRYFEQYQQLSLTPLPERLERVLPPATEGPPRHVRLDTRGEVTVCSLRT